MLLINHFFYKFILLGILLNGCSSKDTFDSYIGLGILKDSINNYLNREMEQFNISGMSITFINDRKVVYYCTKRYSNKQEQLPVTHKTIFEAASISKPLFAMKYVEEGKFDLDKSHFKYLPYPDFEDDEHYKNTTKRMISSHRSGFPYWRSDKKENKLFIKFEIGIKYSYSGEGYQCLANVLKYIENTDWNGLENKFQEKVTKPIGMEHTISIEEVYAKENKAGPYDENRKWIDKKNDSGLLRDQFVALAFQYIQNPNIFSKWLITLMNTEALKRNV